MKSFLKIMFIYYLEFQDQCVFFPQRRWQLFWTVLHFSHFGRETTISASYAHKIAYKTWSEYYANIITHRKPKFKSKPEIDTQPFKYLFSEIWILLNTGQDEYCLSALSKAQIKEFYYKGSWKCTFYFIGLWEFRTSWRQSMVQENTK